MPTPPRHAADPALVAACRAGDQRAWNELVDRYGRLVYSIPRRYGLDDAEADDVFQDVFVALHGHLDRLKDDTRLSAWLITTTHRACWKVGRRTRTQAAMEGDFADLSQPPAERAERWEQQHLVQEALRRLGPPCAPLLLALFKGEEPYAAIAERLGIKVGSIGPTRARCFKKLEPILAELGLSVPGATEAETPGI